MKNRLKQIRKQLGLTRIELSAIVKCTRQNISEIECGEHALTELNKIYFASKLNLPPDCFDNDNVLITPLKTPNAETQHNTETQHDLENHNGVPNPTCALPPLALIKGTIRANYIK